MYNKDMNSASNEQAGLNLPPPVGETLPLPPMPSEVPPQGMEAGPAGPELAAANQPPAAQPAATNVPVVALPTPPPAAPVLPQSDVTSTTPTNVVNVIEDRDLIEKEWVDKAKQIVERTRDDPHLQSKELTVFKAGYMQKQYNKTIKLSE
jgi:hypothetical protein